MKKKVVKKKPVKKAKPVAKPVVKKAVKKKPLSKAAPVKAAPVKVALPPARQPKRVIIGKPAETAVITPAPVEIQAEPPKPVIQKVLPPAAPQPKSAWTGVPRSIPAQIRFLLSAAEKECAAAASWPFPFARFLSTLPQEFCGKEFGLLLMSLSHETSDIAQKTGIAEDEVTASLGRISTHIEECFSSQCNEMYRKWSGSRAAPEALIEPYQIAKVDRNFQTLLGSIIIKCINAS